MERIINIIMLFMTLFLQETLMKQEIYLGIVYQLNGQITSLSVINSEGSTPWNFPADLPEDTQSQSLFQGLMKGGIGDTIKISMTTTNDLFHFAIMTFVGETRLSNILDWQCDDPSLVLLTGYDKQLTTNLVSSIGKLTGGSGSYTCLFNIPSQPHCSTINSADIKAPDSYSMPGMDSLTFVPFGERRIIELPFIFPIGAIETVTFNDTSIIAEISNENGVIIGGNNYPLTNILGIGLSYGTDILQFTLNGVANCNNIVFNIVVCHPDCKSCSFNPYNAPDPTNTQCIECLGNYQMDPPLSGNCVPPKIPQEELELAKKFKDANINIYDPYDPFFNDICVLFPLDGTVDIPRKDRIKTYLLNNESYCDKNCAVDKIDYENAKASCICPKPPQKNSDLTFEGIKENLLASLLEANFEVVLCYMLVFNVLIFPANIGSWVMIGIGISMLINVIISLIKSYDGIWASIGKINQKTEVYEPENHSKKSQAPLPQEAPEAEVNNQDHNVIIVSAFTPQGHLQMQSQNNIVSNQNNKIPEEEEDIDYDEMDYEDLLQQDTRNVIIIYWSYIQTFHPIINSFFVYDKRTPKNVKISSFFVGISLDVFLTAFFYSDKYISNNYNNNGEGDFLYNLPVSLYTYLLGSVISILLGLLSNSEKGYRKIEGIKEEKVLIEKSKAFLKCYKIRIIIYNIIQVIMVICLWYYSAAFCGVYQNSQGELFINFGTSLALSMLLPFVICIIFTIVRMISIKCKCRCLYKILSFVMWFF